MIIAVAFPSYDPVRAEEASGRWAAQGYRTAVVVNKEKFSKKIRGDVVIKVGAYEGYYRTMNYLCANLFQQLRADIVVCAGDRIRPPDHARAHEIATTFAARFKNGIGVMQPCAHAPSMPAQGELESPWIGRNFWARFYGGQGPYHEQYFQYFGNRELAAVASKAGVLWYRPEVGQPVETQATPEWYQSTNRSSYWGRDAAIFGERERLGFEGAEASRLITAKSLYFPK